MTTSSLQKRVLAFVVASFLAAGCGKSESKGVESPGVPSAQVQAAQRSPEDQLVVQIQQLIRQGEARKARDMAKDALKTHPEHIGLHRVYQDAVRAIGHQAQALKKEYADLLANHPDSALYHYLAGRSVFLEDPVEAEMHFRKGIELDPSFLWNYLAFGSLRSRNGDNFGAIQAYQKALERFPDSADLYFNLAEAHYSIGAYRSALDAAEKALKVNPRYALAYDLIAKVHLARKVNDEALKAARQALAINPDLGSANLVMAEVLADGGNRDEARKYAQKALALGQKLPLGLKLKLQLETPATSQ